MRPLRKLVWSVLLGLLALEIVLQIAALVTSFTTSGPAAATGAAAPVLCIGDSYTYGLGATATARSYPGVLQAALRQRDPAAPAVVNAGWPGQNSREALLRLEGQLDEHRPQLVCVLIGLNDSWTRPEPVDANDLAAGHDTGFRWRFRTWRLLALLWREGPELPAVAPPAKPAEPSDAAPAPKQSFATAMRAVELVQAGRHQDAIALLERAIADDPENAPEYHQGLVQIRSSLGQHEQAARSLQWLRDRHAAEPSQAVTEAFATSLHAVGERDQAAALAIAGAERHPRSSTLWWIASRFHYDTGDLARAVRELDQSIATADPSNEAWIANLHRERAKACCGQDLTSAIRSMLSAMHIDRDVDRCRLIVDGDPAAFSKAALQKSLTELAPTGDDLELLQRLLGSGWADRSDMCQVLAQHLGEIVRRCQARGCRVVVLGYPLAVDDVAAVQRGVAEAAKVPFVACMPAFAAQLRTVPRAALYIQDGHCNDGGYALMAATALPVVLAELGR